MGYHRYFWHANFINLDAGSYLRQTYAKDLATEEKEKKYKYPQTCLDSRKYFISMIYSTDVITGTDAVAAQ